MIKPCLARDRTFLSLCSCKIRFCQLNFKFKIFFGGENSPAHFKSKKGCSLVALKMITFLAFQSHARQGRKRNFVAIKASLNDRYHFLSGTYVLYHCIPWDLETWVQKKSNFPVCAGVLNRFVSRLHKKSKILSFM